MKLGRLLLVSCFVSAACQGPAKLADRWEVGEIRADATYVFGATLDGIRRVGRDGSGAALLVPYRSGVFKESEHRPGRIAVDERFVYWTQQGTRPGIDAVRRVSKQGGSADTVFTVHSDAQSGALFLEVDDAFVYVLTYGRGPFGSWILDTAAGYDGGTLLRVSKRDLSVTELATHVRAGSGLALDRKYVYWSVGGSFRRTTSGPADHIYNGDGKLLRIPKTGGAATTVASGLDNPVELQAHNGRLRFRAGRHYERNGWSEDLGFFEVEAVGGSPARIGSRPFWVDDQSRYSLHIEYYGPAGKYGRAAHYYLEREMHGQAERLYTTDEGISSLILDRGELFWLQGTDYKVMRMGVR